MFACVIVHKVFYNLYLAQGRGDKERPVTSDYQPRVLTTSVSSLDIWSHSLWQFHLIGNFTFSNEFWIERRACNTLTTENLKFCKKPCRKVGLLLTRWSKHWDNAVLENSTKFAHKPWLHPRLDLHSLIWAGHHSNKDLPSFRMILSPQKLVDSVFQVVSQSCGLQSWKV